MSIGILWWVLFIVLVVFGFAGHSAPDDPRWRTGSSVVVLILLGMLAWSVYGAPVR